MFLKFPICFLGGSRYHLIFTPILFGCRSTSMYISCKEENGRGRAKGCIFKLLCWGVHHVPEIWVIKWLLLKMKMKKNSKIITVCGPITN